jgi:PIN domain nuclease of toxin-antitoxin system
MSYLEKSGLEFKPVTNQIAKNAFLLKLKHNDLNISMADCIILQTGIEEGATIVTADKEWAKVSEANVKIV